LVREQLQSALREAADHGDDVAAATLRLVMAAVKERDHGLREAGAGDGLTDPQILEMLKDMVVQRQAEIGRCETCAQIDLAEREAQEIRVLQRFLPPQMSEAQVVGAVEETIRALGAERLKDAGRVMATLKERFNGRMDFAAAKRLLCERLH
jgi:hypothetical protein